MAKKPAGPRKIPVRHDLLTADERAALKAEARASVLAEMTQDARDEYFREAMESVRREHVPAEQYLHVMIDVAPFVPFIMIDGIQYFHGYGYDVEQRQALVLYEQMQRSWQHQDQIDGRAKQDAYRRPVNAVLGPQHAGQTTRGANGVVAAEI